MTSFELRQQLIDSLALKLFHDATKQVDIVEKNEGFWGRLKTIILDNLQVTIKNFHIRIESSENLREPFSFGVTLKQLDIRTTNDKGETYWLDRTKYENHSDNTTVHKLLKIEDLGFYYIPCDKNNIGTLKTLK
jgi:hypothetical protein